MASKERLDVAIAARGLAESREKAQTLIMSGAVFVAGQRADKASDKVGEGDEIEVRAPQNPFVSRGGLKLQKAVEVFGVEAQGVVAADIGASTGGFTDVLLQRGAKKVYAVDVGYGQLDWRLRNDPRVVVMERTNARLLRPEDFPERPSLCVMDVSFISIRLILPALSLILGEQGRFVTLVKPQFEAGRGRVGKKGVVRDEKVHLDVLKEILAFVENMGWRVAEADFSPVTGPEGNIEFLFDLTHAIHTDAWLKAADLSQIVVNAHKTLGR